LEDDDEEYFKEDDDNVDQSHIERYYYFFRLLKNPILHMKMRQQMLERLVNQIEVEQKNDKLRELQEMKEELNQLELKHI